MRRLFGADERSDRFGAQVLVGVAADVVIAVTTFSMALVTARAFGPETRGVYALGMAGSALIGVLLDFGVPTAAMTLAARKEIAVARLHTAGLGYAVVMAVGIAGLLAVTADLLVSGPLRGFPAHLLPLLGIAAGASMYLRHTSALLSAERKVRSASLGRVLTVLALAASALTLLAFAGTSKEVAVAIIVSSQVLGVCIFLGVALRAGVGLARPRMGDIRAIFRLGTRSQIGSISRQGFLRIDYYILNSIAGPRATGVYSIAVALAEGVWMIMGSINRALVGRLGAAPRDAAPGMVGQVFRTVIVLAGMMLPALAATAPLAIPFLFGAEYSGAVVPFLVLVLGTMCYGLYSVLSSYVLLQERRPLVNSAVESCVLLASLPLYTALIHAAGMTGAATASAIAYAAGLVALVVYFRVDAVRSTARLLPGRSDVANALQTVRRALGRA